MSSEAESIPQLDLAEIVEDMRPPTDDDVPTTLDGTPLDTPAKLIAHLDEINARREADERRVRLTTHIASILHASSPSSTRIASSTSSSAASEPRRTERHRQTFDIDVVPLGTDENLARLADALRELGARLRVGGMSDDEARQLPVTVDAATLRGFGSSTWTTDAGPVDVHRELPVARGRRSYEELRTAAVARRLHSAVIYLAALDDIVASKEYAGRRKDQEALAELHELQRRQQVEQQE